MFYTSLEISYIIHTFLPNVIKLLGIFGNDSESNVFEIGHPLFFQFFVVGRRQACHLLELIG